MPNVMITCTATKKPVPTGIVMDAPSFATATLTNHSFRCPACGQMHTWPKKDGFLQKT